MSIRSSLSGMWGIAGLGLFLTGCISQHETVYRDVERTKVEFENDRAARLFYETLDRTAQNGSRTESSTKVELPIIFEHDRKVVQGPNTAFNEAVSRCDTNRDGKITQKEAEIFSEISSKH